MSTHNICFPGEIRKIFIWMFLQSGALESLCSKKILKISSLSFIDIKHPYISSRLINHGVAAEFLN